MAQIVARVFLSAFLVVLCQGAVISPRISDSHNIDQCDTTNAKKALLEEDIYENAAFLGFVKRTITYPENTVSNTKITCIRVINTDTGDHGGYPKIVSGGVGSTYVQIQLTSQFNQPLSFRLEIWSGNTIG